MAKLDGLYNPSPKAAYYMQGLSGLVPRADKALFKERGDNFYLIRGQDIPKLSPQGRSEISSFLRDRDRDFREVPRAESKAAYLREGIHAGGRPKIFRTATDDYMDRLAEGVEGAALEKALSTPSQLPDSIKDDVGDILNDLASSSLKPGTRQYQEALLPEAKSALYDYRDSINRRGDWLEVPQIVDAVVRTGKLPSNAKGLVEYDNLNPYKHGMDWLQGKTPYAPPTPESHPELFQPRRIAGAKSSAPIISSPLQSQPLAQTLDSPSTVAVPAPTINRPGSGIITPDDRKAYFVANPNSRQASKADIQSWLQNRSVSSVAIPAVAGTALSAVSGSGERRLAGQSNSKIPPAEVRKAYFAANPGTRVVDLDAIRAWMQSQGM